MRGSVVLPAGTGKKVRVAVFAPGDKAAAAKAAGADIVGMEDLAEQVKAGKMDFDVVIAAPEAMRVVGQLGQILGPRGLMPNPKVGTVTPDVAARGEERARRGQVQFRADKAGIVQCTIGRASFTPEQLRDNLAALVDALNKAKPAATKGIFLKKLSVSSTMGVGVKVDPASLSAHADDFGSCRQRPQEPRYRGDLIELLPAQTAFLGFRVAVVPDSRSPVFNRSKEVDLGS